MKLYQKINVTILFFLSTIIYAQNGNILATVENEQITVEDFKKQFELTPMVFNTSSEETKKEIFLLSMIAQKLWALEADKYSPLENPLIKYSLLEIENKLIRDQLYQVEISSKVNISNEELINAISKYKTRISARLIRTDTKKDIDSIYKSLVSGIEFDSLIVLRPEYEFQKDAITVEFGQMKKEQEDILFELSEGEFSSPLFTELGWVIFYVVNKSINFENASKSTEEIVSGSESVINNRKIKVLYEQFNRSFLGGFEVSADIELFNKLSEILWNEIQIQNSSDKKLTGLSFYEIFSAKDNFTQSELNSPFIKYKNDPVILIDFIGRLGFEGIKTKAPDLNSFRLELSSRIKNFIRLDLLSKEARSRNYDNLPDIQKELEIWKDNYFYSLSISNYKDSIEISDEELDNYVESNSELRIPDILYNVSGLITPSLDKINTVLMKLDEEINFGSIIKNVADSNDSLIIGKSVTLDKLGNLASFVIDMKPGEIYGPIELNNNFAIIKLSDITKSNTDEKSNTASQKESLRKELYLKKLENFIENKTAVLAEKFETKVNLDLLKNVSVTDLNIVVMRSFGFGEKMLAAPIINRQSEWFEIWKSKMRELP